MRRTASDPCMLFYTYSRQFGYSELYSSGSSSDPTSQSSWLVNADTGSQCASMSSTMGGSVSSGKLGRLCREVLDRLGGVAAAEGDTSEDTVRLVVRALRYLHPRHEPPRCRRALSNKTLDSVSSIRTCSAQETSRQYTQASHSQLQSLTTTLSAFNR